MAPSELEVVLRSLAGVFDGEESVDELSHALQCAAHATNAGADSELVAASLFHDIARSQIVAAEHPDLAHEAAAARWLEPRFGARVAWLAGAHVAAKLFLLDTDPGYRQSLSPESVKSATCQQVDAPSPPIGHRWWPAAVQLRRWDDAAKEKDVVLPAVEDLMDNVERIRLR